VSVIIDWISLGLLLLLSLTAYKMRFISFSASIVSYCISILIYYAFYWDGLILLGVFFITSSLLSKWKNKYKKSMEEIIAKGEIRDSIQVLANGGIPLLISIGSLFFPEFTQWEWLYAVSIACANSDTWASEVGTLSRKKPRLFWSFKQVETGTSGGITLLGTIAALFGSFLISLFAFILLEQNVEMLFMISIFGLLGNFIDTLLGSTVQAKYLCLICGKSTEKGIHCENTTQKIRGIYFMNNDVVNLLSICLSTCFFYLFLK